MEQLLKILSKSDNIPIILMVPACIVLLWLWWRAARTNDEVLEKSGIDGLITHMEGGRPDEPDEGGEAEPEKVHTWPYLVRVELIATLAVMLILTVWSITIDAPLEQMADPNRTPNPSKAPWYFLGLQEMLVYFDPWIAGVMLPLLIIGGLMAIPYVDVNPGGAGYYGWKDRRFAVSTFLFGFVVLWLLLIIIGVFCRGPGWNWFWPWETWDAQLAVASPSRNWSDLFGIKSYVGASIFGGMAVASYYAPAVWYWLKKRDTPTLRSLGLVRYSIVAFLFLTMMGLPLKMALRLLLGVKYVWVTPWFNI